MGPFNIFSLLDGRVNYGEVYYNDITVSGL